MDCFELENFVIGKLEAGDDYFLVMVRDRKDERWDEEVWTVSAMDNEDAKKLYKYLSQYI